MQTGHNGHGITCMLCWIDLKLKLGTSTVSRSVPLGTPHNTVPDFVIAAYVIDHTLLAIAADTLNPSIDRAVAVFVKL